MAFDERLLDVLAERVLGRELPPDSLGRFRVITVALAGVLGVLACVMFELEYRFIGVSWQTFATLPVGLAMLVVLYAHRRHGRITLTLNLLLTTFWIITTHYTWFLGGVQSAAVWWFFANPYVAVTCAAPRSAAWWSAICATTVIAFFALETGGVQFPPPPPAHWLPLIHLVSVMLLSAQLIGFLSLLDRARTATTRELQRSNVKLMTARDEALAAAQAKAVFLANMSHEIRTPLNGVLGMAELLGQSSLTEAQRRFVETLRHSGEHLMQVINDVLDFSKLEARHVELERMPFSPRELVERLIDAMSVEARRKGLDFNCVLEPDTPALVVGDALRVRQILFNLTANALKFTSAGSVTVTLRRGPDTLAERPVLVFEVADTGIGINPADIPRLFSAFSQADGSTTRMFGGTGLGLAISRHLSRLMEGDIAVDSRPGEGSRFICTLRFAPATAPRATGAAELRRSRPAIVQAPRVLLVEDNAVNREVGAAMLAQLGCEVELAGDGAAGLAAWMRGGHDLVLMDCQMPLMDGYAATRAIRAEERLRGLPRTPVVAMTANAFREDRDACFDAGMDDFLAKPYTLNQLAEVIASRTSGGTADVPPALSAAAGPR